MNQTKSFGKILFIGFSLIFGAGTALRAARITISWKYQSLPDGVLMRIYEPAAQRPLKLWETKSVNKPELLPVSREITGSSLNLSPGSKKMFVLVMRNEGTKPVYFFAAPHVADPPEFALGFKFKCLCINHVFTVPAGETWYRVVELRVSPKFEGEALDIRHTLIGVSEERMKSFNASPNPSTDDHHSME